MTDLATAAVSWKAPSFRDADDVDLRAPFPALRNDILLRAARRQPVPYVPVWIMRQAGRYLPEFRELRVENSFFELCRTPRAAADATLLPLRRFALDAAIIFSDILVVPQALGMEVEMRPGSGPHFPHPLVSPADMARLESPVNVRERLSYVYDAVRLTRHRLDGHVPLFGFAGAPWTLMAYMIEGGGSRTLSKAKSWLYRYPSESGRLLDLLTDAVVDHLVEQVAAGAQIWQVFDSWAGELSPAMFRAYCLPRLARIARETAEKLRARGLDPVPAVLFARGAAFSLAEMGALGYDVVGVDWTVDPEHARATVGDAVALQGNLDPCALYAAPDRIRSDTVSMVQQFGTRGYIANLGHGIYPDHTPEAVSAFVDAVHAVPVSA